MKKFRLVVRIDNRDVIHGRTIVGGEEEAQPIKDVLEEINNLEYLTLETPQGQVYMPKGLIQRSYFQIEILG